MKFEGAAEEESLARLVGAHAGRRHKFPPAVIESEGRGKARISKYSVGRIAHDSNQWLKTAKRSAGFQKAVAKAVFQPAFDFLIVVRGQIKKSGTQRQQGFVFGAGACGAENKGSKK